MKLGGADKAKHNTTNEVGDFLNYNKQQNKTEAGCRRYVYQINVKKKKYDQSCIHQREKMYIFSCHFLYFLSKKRHETFSFFISEISHKVSECGYFDNMHHVGTNISEWILQFGSSRGFHIILTSEDIS